MVAKRVTAHQHARGAVLSEKQKQLRKASETAEASMVCRKAEVKGTINADLSVDGVTDINWDTVKATANDGMKQIEKSIDDFTREIAELDVKIKELEEANKWEEVGESGMNEMLYAACESFQQEGNPTNDCSWAVEGDCGWNDPVLMDNFIEPPFQEPIDKFTAAATAKITGYSRLSVATFRKHCGTVLSADMCADLCTEFSEVIKTLVSQESGKVLGNTDTLDQLKADRSTKSQQLADATAEKTACAQAQTQLDAFRAQLGKLSGNYKSSKSAVGRYKRVLRMNQMRLRRQIQILEEKKKILERAKLIFAAASEQVVQRQADVTHMQAVLDDLVAQLKAHLILIAEIEEKISQIDAATETGRLVKNELSRILQNAHDTNVQAIHKPLEGLKITQERDIAKDFDDAEASAAPAMKTTVQAVAAYCSTQEATNALTSPLVKVQNAKGGLNHICTGQDWNDMIAEAQASVKGVSKQVVDVLVSEQNNVKSDVHVPVAASMALREAHGEPKGLRHAVATFGGKGSFFDGYLNPGWTVDDNDGSVGTVGKMLMLYQKLGEAAELMQQKWDEAKEHEKVLEQKKTEAEAELERLTVLLLQAIKAKEIAEKNMNDAQKVVDDNQALKDKMEENTKKAGETLAAGEQARDDVKDALLKEHRDRAAALLQVLQEMKK
jgi:hypothetical protein